MGVLVIDTGTPKVYLLPYLSAAMGTPMGVPGGLWIVGFSSFIQAQGE